MAAQSLPLDYELVVYSGTNFRRELRWLPDGITPMDFTGWTAIMPVGPLKSLALMILTSSNGGLTLSATGQIIINLLPAQTLLLPPGVTYYNLDLTDPVGYVRRFMRGRVSVVQDVKSSP